MRSYSMLIAMLVAPAIAHADTPSQRTDAPAVVPATPVDPQSLGVPQPLAPEPTGSLTPHRHRRDRFSNTLSLGVSIGAGSPLGVAGAFLEYRPIRYAALAAGGGFGGSFGPAVAGTLYIDPIVTRGWALGVGASVSQNFSLVSGQVVPGRPALPGATDWASFELQTQVRPSRHWFVRLGVGYAVLLNTQSFHIASEQELDRMDFPSVPGASPIDAMYAAARSETLGVWFVHLDIAPVFRL